MSSRRESRATATPARSRADASHRRVGARRAFLGAASAFRAERAEPRAGENRVPAKVHHKSLARGIVPRRGERADSGKSADPGADPGRGKRAQGAHGAGVRFGGERGGEGVFVRRRRRRRDALRVERARGRDARAVAPRAESDAAVGAHARRGGVRGRGGVSRANVDGVHPRMLLEDSRLVVRDDGPPPGNACDGLSWPECALGGCSVVPTRAHAAAHAAASDTRSAETSAGNATSESKNSGRCAP